MKKISRRQFVVDSAKIAALASTAGTVLMNSQNAMGAKPAYQFAQIPLPYAYSALEPSIDAMTMEIHYTKHHAAYVKNVNDAIAAEKITYASENEFFANASKLSAKARNNAGGVWNHNFFWKIMDANGGSPSGKIQEAITRDFGGIEKLQEQFNQAALGRFGSGWAWLVKTADGKLKIGSTANQDNPLMDSSELKGTPVLAIDVWEHAYYLKYQNRRNEYVANWWKVVNWKAGGRKLWCLVGRLILRQ